MVGRAANTAHDDCVRIVHRAPDAGIDFVDTADVYSRGESKEITRRRSAAERAAA
ncbi:aldo/keto reductase [Streptosporangium sp. CA-135522]|uniref:aldo/keto reductase n=1 Tax=Streptosporangium sp. CA-135522 TaxID=3240072 RepID=UPI003D937D05